SGQGRFHDRGPHSRRRLRGSRTFASGQSGRGGRSAGGDRRSNAKALLSRSRRKGSPAACEFGNAANHRAGIGSEDSGAGGRSAAQVLKVFRTAAALPSGNAYETDSGLKAGATQSKNAASHT